MTALRCAADSAWVGAHKRGLSPRSGQDRTGHGTNGHLSWVVLSDGCGSAEESQAGAQAFVDAAHAVLLRCEALADTAEFTDAIMQEVEPVLSALPTDAGFATLSVLMSDGKTARALVYGDGCVAALDADDELQLWTLSAGGNAPRYLQYDRLRVLRKCWEAEPYSEHLRVATLRYDLGGGRRAAPALKGMRNELLPGRQTRVWQKDWTAKELSNLQALVIASDGLMAGRAVTGAQLLKTLLNTGRGLGSRLRALHRLGAILPGYELTDDLSVGVLRPGSA